MKIVSGYASPAMALHHLKKVSEVVGTDEFHVNLIIGMAGVGGIELQDHKAYIDLQLKYDGKFTCHYVAKPSLGIPSVHSKVYAWIDSEISFLGSPNYSIQGFDEKRQRNAASLISTESATSYFTQIEKDALPCSSDDLMDFVRIGGPKGDNNDGDQGIEFHNSPHVGQIEASLLNASGIVSQKSALNWGIRDGRNPDQAYIPLNGKSRDDSFWPPVSSPFYIHTDDGEVLGCVRAQANGKAIHTYESNAIMGRYFRRRLGVPSGTLIEKRHLHDYGRTSLSFAKIDDERFFMDFSV